MINQPDQESSRPRVKVTVAELVKFNASALLRDRAMKDQAFKDQVDNAVNIYSKVNPGKPLPTEVLDIDFLKAKSDPNQWGQKEFGKRIGRKSSAIHRMLTPVEDGGNAGFEVIDLLLIAAELQVPIAFLLHPTREQIDSNSILIFEEFNEPLEVTANQWLGWVNGLTALPGGDATLQAFNSLSMSTAHMAGWIKDKKEPPKAKATDTLNIDDTQRIAEGVLTASAPIMDVFRTSTYRDSEMHAAELGNITDVLADDHQIAVNRARLIQGLLFHVREALVITSDQNRPDLVEALLTITAVIQDDILQLALAIDKDIPIPSTPFTKDVLIEQLRLITIFLSHLELAEIEYEGFQQRVPREVRLPQRIRKKERKLLPLKEKYDEDEFEDDE
jgi:hypothetical protein